MTDYENYSSYYSPHCWGLTKELEEKLRALWYEAITSEELAKEANISTVTLIKYGKILGLPMRQEVRKARTRVSQVAGKRLGRPIGTTSMKFKLLPAQVYGLRIEAEKRNMPVEFLCQKLISVIVGDKLIDAVLDDA